MISYSELQRLIVRAADGDCEAATDLGMLYQSGYARILSMEVARQFHLLMFKCIAMPFSQEFRFLLDKVPALTKMINGYKEEPSLKNLNSVLEALIGIGKKSDDEVLTKLSMVINRAFLTLAKEHDEIIRKVMPEYSLEIINSEEAKNFKAHPTFRTFVEDMKKLNDTFKSYQDKRRCRSLLFYTAYLGSERAVTLLSEQFGQPCIEVKEESKRPNSLLGCSYAIYTVWDEARKYSAFPC